jgi:Tfp pilus assembly PilM family ATPase
MKPIKEILQRLKRGPTDVLGIDLGTTGAKMVRLSKNAGGIAVLGANTLPDTPMDAASANDPNAPPPAPMALPASMKSRYASLALTGRDTVVKLLTFPTHLDTSADAKIVQSLGLKDPDSYRVSYRVIVEGAAKTESRVLAVAVPEVQTRRVSLLFPSGLPVPRSIEVSGLAALNAFLHTPRGRSDDAVGVLDFGARITSFALFNRGTLSLLRRFDLGMDDILKRIAQTLGVDEGTALSVLADHSFDVSRTITGVLEPLIKQLIVSRDFLERRENCHINQLIVGGGLVISRDALRELATSLEIEVVVLNPFDGLSMAHGALSPDAEQNPWRYSAAVGAAVGARLEAP